MKTISKILIALITILAINGCTPGKSIKPTADIGNFYSIKDQGNGCICVYI